MRDHRVRVLLVPFAVAAILASAGCAEVLSQLETATRGLPGDSRPEDGVREALRVGTGRAVDLLAAKDGFLGSADVRIPLPDKLEDAARVLRTVGAGDLVDEFVTSINRAAEAAVPQAKPVFVDAIRSMTVDDALTILRGDDHEATDYFRGRTEDRLADLFRPVVDAKLGEVGATRSFERLMDRVERLPLVDRPPIDLDDHVTRLALDGLFTRLAQEERKIREDPVARTTELLRRWFGRDL